MAVGSAAIHLVSKFIQSAKFQLDVAYLVELFLKAWRHATRQLWELLIGVIESVLKALGVNFDVPVTEAQKDALTLLLIFFAILRVKRITDDGVVTYFGMNIGEGGNIFVEAILKFIPILIVLFIFAPVTAGQWINEYNALDIPFKTDQTKYLADFSIILFEYGVVLLIISALIYGIVWSISDHPILKRVYLLLPVAEIVTLGIGLVVVIATAISLSILFYAFLLTSLNVLAGLGYSFFGAPLDESFSAAVLTTLLYVIFTIVLMIVAIWRTVEIWNIIFLAVAFLVVNYCLVWIEIAFGDEIERLTRFFFGFS